MESEHLFLHGHCYFVTRMLYVQHGMRNSFSLVLNRVKMKFVIVGIRLRTRSERDVENLFLTNFVTTVSVHVWKNYVKFFFSETAFAFLLFNLNRVRRNFVLWILHSDECWGITHCSVLIRRNREEFCEAQTIVVCMRTFMFCLKRWMNSQWIHLQ
jgi:hypothetical protein